MKIYVSILCLAIVLCSTVVPVVYAEMNTQEKIDYYKEQIETTQATASTLVNTVKYFNDSIVLNEQNVQNIEGLIKKTNSQKDGAQSSGWNPFRGLTWNQFLCYPFETIWYAIKHLFIKVDPIEKEQLAQQSQAKQKEIDILTSRLTIQRQQLDSLKNEKAYLLTLTQNDEKKYQELLASAQEELIAQQAIFSGEVTETEEGVFKKGDVIAKIISGKSPCSTGTHLHFEVRDNKLAVNPAEYLSQVPLRWGIGPLQETSFSGSWPWPVTVPAVITQEFGMSWFARPGGYSLQGSYGGKPHTGLDMVSEVGDLQVFAPSAGTLYSGKISCGGGKLSYVHLKVSSKISIYFLHVNTQ